MSIGLLAVGGIFAWRLKSKRDLPLAEPRWTEDVGVVRNARLRGFQIDDAKGARATLEGHDIQKGDGVVVYWRRFGDDPAREGEEAFQMLTIELPDLSAAKRYRLGDPGVRGFYSRGASAGVGGWYAPEIKGLVWVSGLAPESMTLSFDLSFPLRRSVEGPPVPEEILTFRRDLSCSRKPTENLTPWLRGQSPYRR